MTTAQIAALVAVMAAVTFLTRARPFLLFGRGGEPPGWCSTWGGCSPRR